MANQATTLYRISSENKQSVIEFWNILQSMNVNTKNIWLDELAKRYGIDYEARHISVRGHIYWAEYNEEDNILSIETETAWDKSELIEEINKVQGYPFSVSYRVCECGCEVFYVHDEGSFFTEELLVHTENHLTKHVRTFLLPSRMPSRNGLQRPVLSKENVPMKK